MRTLFKQMEDTLEYLNLCNKKTFIIEGIQRIEKSDYPIEAIKETKSLYPYKRNE